MRTICISLIKTPLFLLLLSLHAYAQNVVISDDPNYITAEATALLDLMSKERGLLVPRMTATERNAIAEPVVGLLVFQTDEPAGFYYFSDSSPEPEWRMLVMVEAMASANNLVYITNSSGIASCDNLFWDPEYSLLGIGTANPVTPLTVATWGICGVFSESTADNGYGIIGYNSSPQSFTYGVAGESVSSEGFGIFGLASSGSGLNYGVFGKTESSEGYGIFGYNASLTGESYGLAGRTESTEGYGMYGVASSGSGINYGVVGRSNSDQGFGVYGSAISTTGVNYGLVGESKSLEGYGVFGHATASTGLNYGTVGRTESSEGFGAYGIASSTSGFNYGVVGRSDSDQGYGVYGTATSLTGENYGVVGRTESASGFGAYGYATASSGLNYGVVGKTNSSQGYGVLGLAASTNGVNYGCVGRSESSQGYGVVGINAAITGVTFGVFGAVESYDGFSGYFSGGRFYASGPVGIGAEIPLQKLHLVGNAFKTEGGTTWLAPSDERLKNINGIYEKGLKEIISLKPIRFTYKENNDWKLDPNAGQVGFLAQDVKEIFPEAVSESNDGFLLLNHHAINVAVVNAIRELNNKLESYETEIERLKMENQAIMALISRLETLVTANGGNGH